MSDPTTGTRVAITSLAQIEDKLRRALNLAGDVGLQFRPDAIPVVIAGDATLPGNATYRGRRFAGSFAPAATGAAASIGIKALENIVITDLDMYAGTAGINATVRLATTDVAEPYAMTTQWAPWTERAVVTTDFAPVARSVVWAATSSSGQIIAASGTIVGVISLLKEPVMLTTNQFLIVNLSGAVTANVSMAGYVF